VPICILDNRWYWIHLPRPLWINERLQVLSSFFLHVEQNLKGCRLATSNWTLIIQIKDISIVLFTALNLLHLDLQCQISL
jgi:hypothetical protein